MSDRRIGRFGTIARGLLGLAFVLGALAVGPVSWVDAVLGLLVLPLGTTLLLRLRGSDAAPLRWTSPGGHVVNSAIAVVVFIVNLKAALLFYGAAMLLAMSEGYAGCELFAFANRFNRRNDEIGCPVFWPIDAVERRATSS